MTFRSPATRAVRGLICAAMALGLGWAIRDEIVTPHIQPATRGGWLAATILFELVMLAGLQRLWAVRLVVDEAGVTVRNFRGDIRLRHSEIKEVFQASDFSGFHVALRLKTGAEIHLDGVTWVTPGRTSRAVNEISEALGLSPPGLEAPTAPA